MPLVFPYPRDSLMKLVDAKSNLGTLSTQTLSHISLIAAYNWRNLGCKQKSSMNVSWHQRDLLKTPELIRNRKNRWLPLKKNTKEPKQKKILQTKPKHICYSGVYFSTSCFSIQPGKTWQEQSLISGVFCCFQIPSFPPPPLLSLLSATSITDLSDSFLEAPHPVPISLVPLGADCQGHDDGHGGFGISITQDWKSGRSSLFGTRLRPRQTRG